MASRASIHERYEREDQVQGSSDRSFGVVFACVFSVIGALPLISGGTPRAWAFGIAAGFLAAALARPKLLSPLNRVWLRFGLLLHRIISPLVLGILFFAVITPVAVVTRLFGRDVLRRRLEPAAASYWLDRDPVEPSTMQRQF